MTHRRTAEALLFETPEKGSANRHDPMTAGTLLDERPKPMTTENLLADRSKGITTETFLPIGSKVMTSETQAPIGARLTRRRVSPIYCRSCAGWVEVLLQPVRLRCARCGVEARP